MAQRRMISLKVVDTDIFLEMPASSQLLYLHLLIRADDDGFVSNPKKIMRIIGANEDDLKVLITKQFIIPFDSGVCVIKHWRMHNLIRKDRYNETIYLEEKSKLFIDKNGFYSTEKTNVIPNDNQRLPQDRLGKVKLVKDSLVKSKKTEKSETKIVKFTPRDMEMTDLLINLIQTNNPEWQMKGKRDDWAEHIEKLHRIDGRSYEQIEAMIRWVQADNFWHKNILSTSKLREKFNDLIPRIKNNGGKGKTIIGLENLIKK